MQNFKANNILIQDKYAGYDRNRVSQRKLNTLCTEIAQTNLQISCFCLKYNCAAFESLLGVSEHHVISLVQPAPLD